MTAISEAAFQQQVEQLAGFYGWQHRYHAPDNRPVQTRGGRVRKQRVTPGFPDLCLVRVTGDVGELVFAELKVGRNRPTAEQLAWLRALRACGVEAYCWTPDDFDGLHERLARGRAQVEPLYRAGKAT